jgi:hypothetical protein
MINNNTISRIYILTNPVLINDTTIIIQYLNFILVDNEVGHSVEITSWKQYLNFFTV